MPSSDPSSNPYSAPASNEARHLPRWEKKLLEFFLAHRNTDISMLELVGRFLRRWVPSVVLAAGVMLLSYGLLSQSLGPSVAWFLIGVVVGAVLADIGTIRRTLALWPLYQQILDWDKIEQLVANEKSGRNE